MIYGLYLSAQGAEAQTFRQTVLANNLANAQTTAFKRDIPVFRAHLPFDAAHQTPFENPPGHEDQTGGVSLAATITDWAQGPLEVTDRPLDLALMGPGFFEVGVGNDRLLTRNGKLAINHEQTLVTADHGYPILDATGQSITIPEGTRQISINGDGSLSVLGPGGRHEQLATLSVVDPAAPELLLKEGDGLYRPQGEVLPAVEAQVRQGILEGSSTDPVHGMVELIETSRAFEMNMNLVRYQDEMLGQLISSVARK